MDIFNSSRNNGTSGALKSAKEGSKLKKRFKAVELRAKLEQLKAEVAMGRSDVEICDSLGVTPATYNQLKKELYRQETAALYNQSTEDIYLEYSWKQQSCIDDLNTLLSTLEGTKQHNAIVGAVRAKSDIIDKIVKTGQDMGILEKAPERKMVLHGVAVAKLDNANLRKLIANELSGLASVMSKYGDVDLMGNPITTVDVPKPQLPAVPTPAPKFNGNGRPKQSSAGPQKAAAARKSRVAVKRVKAVAPATIGS